METTATYHSELETLRAEVKQLNEELLLVSTNQPVPPKPKKRYRWQVDRKNYNSDEWTEGASFIFALSTAVWLGWCLVFVAKGLIPAVVRGATIPAIFTAVWFGCFCKLVPVKEDGK